MKLSDAISTGLVFWASALFLSVYTNDPQPAFLICSGGLVLVGLAKGLIEGGR